MDELKRVGDGERLRAAFRTFMSDHNASPAEIARNAGFPTPNAIYNFLNGHTRSLSRGTLEAIADAYPGVTVDRLSGRVAVPFQATPVAPPIKKVRPAHQDIVGRLFVMLEVVPGEWRGALEFEPERSFNLPMPVDISLHSAGAYGAIVRPPGAELLFPHGTVLVCLSPKAGSAALTDGAVVLLRRQKGDLKQLSIRQIERKGQDAWLCCRSRHLADQRDISLPRLENVEDVWSAGSEKLGLYAVVVGAYCPYFANAA